MPGSSVPERGGGSGKIPNIFYTFQTTVLLGGPSPDPPITR